ncbi:MAG: nucleotidyl transferase AbiEii/AbiGii toxin family protein [Gammaproteobacteria bacterium]|nr:nucleotidyl transferase AbiEii/AbiGii toxin family protein [Gammaproteobacteria bacterium]
MQADRALDHLIHEPGRCAVLRSELLALSDSSTSSCDKALKRKCESGILVRVGHGIYGIGNAKVFQIVPEVMPKLGYEFLHVKRVSGYSQKSGGSVWRLDKPCRRVIRKRGVWAVFEGPDGTVTNVKDQSRSMNQKPSKEQIEDHFHRFERCHSRARAEKDLIVQHCLDALESFDDDRAILAIEGGTALAYYHRMITRFSEDLDIRLVLSKELESLDTNSKIEIVKDIGVRFQNHVATELSYLIETNKGRVRRDGVVQSLIFDYEPIETNREVVAGLKFELVFVPLLLDLTTKLHRNEQNLPAVNPVETAAGKLIALCSRLPENADSNPDIVRHIHDLASLFPSLSLLEDQLRSAFQSRPVDHETLKRTVKEVRRPVWEDHYRDYLRRMGMSQIADVPGGHPTWQTVQNRFAAVMDMLV